VRGNSSTNGRGEGSKLGEKVKYMMEGGAFTWEGNHGFKLGGEKLKKEKGRGENAAS